MKLRASSKPENMCTDHISLSLPSLYPRRYQQPPSLDPPPTDTTASSSSPRPSRRAVYPVVSRQLTPQTRAARESCVLCAHCGRVCTPIERERERERVEKEGRRINNAIIPLLPSNLANRRKVDIRERRKKGENQSRKVGYF